jgi:cytochrome b involved in lipid metabolism
MITTGTVTRRNISVSASGRVPKITWKELEKHNDEKSCWICIEDKVYDVTEWIQDHPGEVI